MRKLVGYLRYDTPAAVAALNALYRHELRLFQNLFLPSVKLVRKERVGARLRRRYDAPRTPLERVQACPEADPAAVALVVRSAISSIPSPCPRRSTGRSSGWLPWPPPRGLAGATAPPPKRRPSPRLPPPPAAAPTPEDALHFGNRLRRPRQPSRVTS